MGKIRYESLAYYYGLLTLMIGVILRSFYQVLNGSSFVLIHLSLTLIALILVLSKNKYSKMIIKIWSSVFFILAGILLTVGPLLQLIGSWMSDQPIPDKSLVIVWGLINLLIGVIVFMGANNFIFVNEDVT